MLFCSLYRTLERKQLLHILPISYFSREASKVSSHFLNSNSTGPKSSVPFGVITTCNSALPFEAASDTKSRVCHTIHFQEVRAASHGDQSHTGCMLCLAASLSRALSKLPEHFVLLDEGVAPPAPQHKSQHNIMLQLE